MNFEETVKYVMKEHSVAFAYSSRKEGEMVVGADIYVLLYQGAERFQINYLGGNFHDTFAHESVFHDQEIPTEAKKLIYRKTILKSDYVEFCLLSKIDVVLKFLNGYSESNQNAVFSYESRNGILFENCAI